MKLREETLITFDDVLLEPQYSEIESRSTVSIAAKLTDKITLGSPLIGANMDSISSVEMAVALHQHGGMCPIHRFMSIEEQVEAVETLARASCNPIAATIGVSGDWEERLVALTSVLVEDNEVILASKQVWESISRADKKNKKSKTKAVKAIFIDIAHANCSQMVKVLETCVKRYPDIDFIPGNVATVDAVLRLEDAGAAAIKIGIGGGSICSTRLATGVGVPQLSAIMNCAKVAKVPLIADGGITKVGDIVKALAAGASTVMVGHLIAGTKEAAGNIINVDGVKFKVYRGQASKDSQLDWKGGNPKYIFEEGVSSLVPYKGKVSDIIINAHNGIKSGLSYCGSRNLEELREKAVFQRVSQNTIVENNTRVRFGK